VINPSDRKKYIPTDVLEREAAQVTNIARSKGVNVAVVGGLAMQVYGSSRLTGDLDMIADAPINLPIMRELSFGGYETVSPGGIELDWIIRNDFYQLLYLEALKESEEIMNGAYRVVPLHYLAAMKMAAKRLKDKADLDEMFSFPEFDEQKTREIINKFLGPYALEDFESMLFLFKWNRSRDKK